MGFRNDGISESNILQNEFTAYLQVCLQNRKRRYYRQKRRCSGEIPLNEYEDTVIVDSIEDSLNQMPAMQQLEDERLFRLLLDINRKELVILLLRVLDEKTFEEIARELNLNLNTAKTIYSRLMKKLRLK